MIRIAAVGDVHMDTDVLGRFRPALRELGGCADALLLAGDLTRHGTVAEARCVATEFGGLDVPVVAVLGNHDHHSDRVPDVVEVLTGAGLTVLEGDGVVLDTPGGRLGVAGVKGFGGGFAGRCASEFGEPEMKTFMRRTERSAARIEDGLTSLTTDVRLVLLHYAPVKDTVVGERPEIYPFLGSFLLARAVDAVGADLVVHGHAHAGTEQGVTPGGVRAPNVAQPLIRRSYRIFCLED